MASTTAVSLETLIDEALDLLYADGERPRQYVVGSTALAVDADTTLTITGAGAGLQPPTVLEHDQELMLVTGRSTDPTPVFTVARGYARTPKSAAPAGTVLLDSPRWSRFKVRRQILRAVQGSMATQIPLVLNTVITPVHNQMYVEVPATTMRVLRVAINQFQYAGSLAVKQWMPFDDWEFVDDVDIAVSSTHKIVTIPPRYSLGVPATPLSLYVTYQAAYAWSGGGAESPTLPAEAETVNLPQGAEDLPALYAAAHLVLNREISRTQLDKTYEWTQGEGDTRSQSNMRLAQMLWTEYYRRLDEARRLQVVPKHRPYRPMRRRVY